MESGEIEPLDVVIDVDSCCANVGNKPRPCTSFGETGAGPYRLTPESLLFTMPGVARYRCRRDGRALTVEPEPKAADEEITAYLLATALPALLWLRETVVLHAAAAVLPGSQSAVALAGASGTGKSTLLRRLLETGASAVADDCLALRDCCAHPVASGLPGATQLVTNGQRVFVPVASDRQLGSARLTRLVELRPGAPDSTPRRLRGPESLAALLRNLYRPRIPRLLALDAMVLRTLAATTDKIEIYSWSAEAARSSSPAQLLQTLGALAG